MSIATQRLPLLELPVGQRTRGVGVVEVAAGERKSILPLKSVDIKAEVAERIASVTITQKFANNLTEHMEAVYIFPLSGGCVVSKFEMRVGKRVIKGTIKERSEARQQYQQAVLDGKRAALLEQERDDVFTVQVGNIPPGEEVSVSLTYCEKLVFFEDGLTEISLPLVVAERYIPGSALPRAQVGAGVQADTDAVPDASRISPPLLAPGFDPKVDLKVSVEIASAEGLSEVEELCCSQHAISTRAQAGRICVELAKDNERLNRDFVLRWRLAGAGVKSSLVVYHGEDGDYGMLSILPPKRSGYLGAARDVIFLLDRSGSMMGQKMISAARACSLLLETLGPADRFAICTFDSTHEWQRIGHADGNARFCQADEANIESAKQALRAVTARGGTELYAALADCLSEMAQSEDRESRVPVVVVLTDGEVGDDARIFKLLQTNLGDCRLFTVGIDTAVNSGLLRRMATIGGGTASFVQPGALLEDALAAIGREIGQPVVTELSVATSKGVAIAPTDLAPARVPDVFAGRASCVFLRLCDKSSLSIKGKLSDGSVFQQKVKPSVVSMPAIAFLWAKLRISELEDSFRVQPDEATKRQIIQLAIQHGVLCRLTAYVAIDHKEIVNKDGSVHQIVQPVEQAQGWQMYCTDVPVLAQQAQIHSIVARASASFSSKLSSCDAVSWAAPEHARAAAPQSASGFMGNAPAQPPVPPAPQAMPGAYGASHDWAAQIDEIRREDQQRRHQAVMRAFEALQVLLKEAYASITGGCVPAADRLLTARQSLLHILGQSDLAEQLPLLQRFVRGALKELINGLTQSPSDIAPLQELWDRHMKELDKAQAEFAQVMSKSSQEEKFWESSI
jgi:Ca-activated chloride channel family protein